MNGSEKDCSNKLLVALGIGLVLFIVSFVLICIYSRNTSAKLFFTKPLCMIPFAELGLTVGIFFGMDKDLRTQTRLIGSTLFKLVIVSAVFEAIRSCVTFGTDTLISILGVLGENDDVDASLAGCSIINLMIITPIMLGTLFLGRGLGKLIPGSGSEPKE